MSLTEKDTEALLQALTDAGCCTEKAQSCAALAGASDITALVKALSAHRETLLQEMHRAQKKIDCLDYLLYQLKKYGEVRL